MNEKIRMYSVASLGVVDWVYLSDVPSYDDEIISVVKPDIFVRVRRKKYTEKQNKLRIKRYNNKYP